MPSIDTPSRARKRVRYTNCSSSASIAPLSLRYLRSLTVVTQVKAKFFDFLDENRLIFVVLSDRSTSTTFFLPGTSILETRKLQGVVDPLRRVLAERKQKVAQNKLISDTEKNALRQDGETCSL